MSNRLRPLRAVVIAASFLALGPPGSAAAQSARFGQSYELDGIRIDVINRWEGARSEVVVATRDARVTIHRGAPVFSYAATGPGGILVALVGGERGVQIGFVPVRDGRPSQPAALQRVPRPNPNGAPVGAAIAARPDGFAVFWQEANATNPNTPYETYLARTRPDGTLLGESVAVPAPWPLADVAWLEDEGRYFFLLFYGTEQSTMLCGVHVNDGALNPAEHPWWASRGGAIDEAHLARRGGRVVAIYRDGDRLLESDVTEGSWGRAPGEPRSHGAITRSQSIVIRRVRDGVEARGAALY
ncbi:MAG: hypothetical protein AB7S26_16830 [Sandaracinaceae bacterium]